MPNPYPWSKRIIEWTQGSTAYLSVVFTWHLPQAYQRAAHYAAAGYTVRAGGPAVALMPDYLASIAQIGGHVPAVHRHNPAATFTSRGCPRQCAFCPVPILEGDLVELTDWHPQPCVVDNNLLACSNAHFDRVVDRLKPLPHVDFTQGLDARFLTTHHAQRLAELRLHRIRLAWDRTRYENQVHTAIQRLRTAGIPKKTIRVYVIFGFHDSPDDALYRFNTLKRHWGIDPIPMRYQPLTGTKKNAYVDPGWTDRELRKMQSYWWRTRWYGSIPYEQFDPFKTPEDAVTIPEGYRSVREAAAITQTSRNTIYQWVYKDLLPHVRHEGHIYVDVDAVPACRQRDRISTKIPPPLPEDKLITIKQAHAISGIPVRTIHNYASTGQITAVQHGTIWYVSLENLQAITNTSN